MEIRPFPYSFNSIVLCSFNLVDNTYRHHSELQSRFAKIRKAQGLEDALDACIEVADFLKEKNQAALNSFLEAGEELFAVHFFECTKYSQSNTAEHQLHREFIQKCKKKNQ